MMQLNLFEHAPRHYHDSLHRLGRLDLVGCREALSVHREKSPAGPDPEPVEHALSWLQPRLPAAEDKTEAFGRTALALSRTLRGEAIDADPVPALLDPRSEHSRNVLGTLAQRALQRMTETDIPPETPLSGDLPWGVFLLFLGRAPAARRSLLDYLRGHEPTAAACLALGEACLNSGRGDEALCAWREGYGLDPAGACWAPLPVWIEEVRAGFTGDPDYDGLWWAVGAYLEGHFPRYPRADPALVVRRWQRFARIRGTDSSAEPSAAALFFSSLFLSEHGADLPNRDLAQLRRTLVELHPEAYQRHREQLEDLGPLKTFPGREYFCW